MVFLLGLFGYYDIGNVIETYFVYHASFALKMIV